MDPLVSVDYPAFHETPTKYSYFFNVPDNYLPFIFVTGNQDVSYNVR